VEPSVRHLDLDGLLSGAASALRRQLRISDIVGRVDRRTICVILPEAGESQALWVSPRLRKIIEDFLVSTQPQARIRMGLASRPMAVESPEDFIQRAIATPVPPA